MLQVHILMCRVLVWGLPFDSSHNILQSAGQGAKWESYHLVERNNLSMDLCSSWDPSDIDRSQSLILTGKPLFHCRSLEDSICLCEA